MELSKGGILVASDPELFVLKDGKVSSIAGVLGYGKDNKLDLGNGIRVQEDNVLLEFDIDPYDSKEVFNSQMAQAIAECERIAGENGFEIATGVSSHVFTQAELDTFDPSAFVFGCDPDYNALLGQRNPPPAAADPGLRTAGGHVHIGFDHLGDVKSVSSFGEAQKILAIMCDYFLGMPSLLLDGDDQRRELYGKAGATRFKEYGIEYRTLSNYWVHEEANRSFIFDQVQKAHAALVSGEFAELGARVDPNEIQRIINEGDRKMAEAHMKSMGII